MSAAKCPETEQLCELAFPLAKRPRTVIEEVYTRWYLPRESRGGGSAGDTTVLEDTYLYCHPNGLAVVGITAQHSLLKHAQLRGSEGGEGGMANFSVDFTKGGKSAAPEKRSGKKAKGGVQLQPESVLCTVAVTPRGGGEAGAATAETVKLRCGVRGLLLEINQRIVSQPELLLTSPQNEGHVAIVKLLPGEEKRIREDEAYLSAEQYAHLRGVSLDSLGM